MSISLWRVMIGKKYTGFIYQKLNLPLDVVKQMKKQSHPLKIMSGDVMSHYPYGKIFYVENMEEEAEKFFTLISQRIANGDQIDNRETEKCSNDVHYDEETGRLKLMWEGVISKVQSMHLS